MTTKILLDTDIGDDVDDAVCLAYLLAKPECELVGITTVSDYEDQRAQIASSLCKAAGQKIPIFPGCGPPMIVPSRNRVVRQAVRLGNWDHDTEFPRGQAISFMRETIRANPGEIVLLTIGPLTNAALLFTMDPEIPSLLKGLVMMAGIFTTTTPAPRFRTLETNALLDPHATAIAYKHDCKIHRSIGLDVTLKVKMLPAEVKERFTAPLLQPVLDYSEVWFEQRKTITFHDPLAAATIFNDNLCKFEKGNVEVELTSPRLLGMTHWDPNVKDPRHEIAMEVDPGAFFEEYFSVF
jgi:purine nucleosidase